MIRILHLSDLHFGEFHYWDTHKEVPKLEVVIGNALIESGIKVDCIIVTGDLITKGIVDDFTKVRTFLNNLTKLGITNEDFDIIITPGNHDFRWENAEHEELSKFEERSLHFMQFNGDVVREFRKKIDEEKIGFSIPSNLIDDMNEEGIDWTYISKKDEDAPNILFIALNSLKVMEKEDRDFGLLGYNQIEAVKHFIKYFRDNIKDDNLTIFALCHHHLVPVNYFEHEYMINKRVSITLDSRALLDILQEIGCRVVFHGHHHQPSCISWRDRIGKNKRTINIIGAGSVGAYRDLLGDVSQNQFYIHNIHHSGIKSDSFITKSEDRRYFLKDNANSTEIFWAPQHVYDEDCQIAYRIPKNSKNVKSLSGIDESNLFLLFLNVIDCEETRMAVINFCKSQSDIRICGLYDLFGRFDTLIRFREEKSGEARKFVNLLKEHLVEQKLLRETEGAANYHFIDINFESYNIEDFINKKKVICQRRIIDDDGTDINPKITIAFLEILLNSKLDNENFIKKLNEKILTEYSDHYKNITNILRGIHSQDSDKIIFELRMSCKQFHYLNVFSKILEKLIDKHQIDKWTHIAYTSKEISE